MTTKLGKAKAKVHAVRASQKSVLKNNAEAKKEIAKLREQRDRLVEVMKLIAQHATSHEDRWCGQEAEDILAEIEGEKNAL